MKLKLPLILLFTHLLLSTNCQNLFDKKVFYEILSASDLKLIDSELLKLTKQAHLSPYVGTLLMKKAGLISNPQQKLELFKSGKTKLEDALQKDTSHVEFRFLRLIIQENSPKILQYNKEIKRDASYLRKNYTELEAIVQHALYNFSQTSGILKPEDFKSLKHE
jgi:hypothetical protein